MLKRKSKKPNIIWHTFSLDNWAVPRLFLDWGYLSESRYSDMYPKGRFNYSYKELYVRIGSNFIHRDRVLEVSLISNQQEWLKYWHQEWGGIKDLFQGALFK